MNLNEWEWTSGIVNTNNRYFELKFGYVPTPVARIGIGDNQNFIVEFLLSTAIDPEQQEEIFREIVYEIELYLINNSELDPITYMIKHTQKCANLYSKIHWGYFPKGSKRKIILTKHRDVKTSNNPFFNFFSRIMLDN
jgi:hypothetical protein